MSKENVELVRAAFGDAGSLALEDVSENYWDPDVEYVEDPRWPGASRYKGRDAVLRCFRAYVDAMGPADQAEVTVERVLEAGERLVLRNSAT